MAKLSQGFLHKFLFIFHDQKRPLPDFVKCVECPPPSEDEAKNLLEMDVCKDMIEFIRNGMISLNEIMVLDRVVQRSVKTLSLEKEADKEQRKREEQLLVIACLFAERKELHGIVERITEQWKQQRFIDSDRAQGVRVTLSTGIIKITDYKGNAEMARGKKVYQSGVPFAELSKASNAVKCAVFTACIAGYKHITPSIPLLCVGDEAVTAEVCRLLDLRGANVDVTPAATIADVLYDARSRPVAEVKGFVDSENPSSDEYARLLSAGISDKESMLVFQPGPLVTPSLCDPARILRMHNPQLALEPLRSQIGALLTNPEGLCIDWPEGKGNDFEAKMAILSCSSRDLPQLAHMVPPDRFIRVVCKEQDFRTPLLERLQTVFSISIDIEPFVQFLQASSCRRRQIRMELMESAEEGPWNALLTGEPSSVDVLSHLVVSDTLKCIEAVFSGDKALTVGPTALQMALALAMGVASRTPVILESAEAVGKTTMVQQYLRVSGATFEYLRLSPTTTISPLFGSFGPGGNGGRGRLLQTDANVIVLDNADEAPAEVLAWLAIFLQCAVRQSPFVIHGNTVEVIPKATCIVLCARGHVLPDSLYSNSLLFRDITLSPRDKTAIAASHFGDRGKVMEMCASQPDFLRKTQLVKEIFAKNPSQWCAAWWLVFGCSWDATTCHRLSQELHFSLPSADNSPANCLTNALSTGLYMVDVLMVVDDSSAWRDALCIPAGKQVRKVIVTHELFPEAVKDPRKPDAVFWKAMRYGDWLVFEHCEFANKELMEFFRLLCEKPLSTFTDENETCANLSFRVVFHTSTYLPLPCVCIRSAVFKDCLTSTVSCITSRESCVSSISPRETNATLNDSNSLSSRSLSVNGERQNPQGLVRDSIVSSTELNVMKVVEKWCMDSHFELALGRSEDQLCVSPKMTTPKRISFQRLDAPIDSDFLQNVLSLASQTLMAMLASTTLTTPVAAVTVIIDTNITICRAKARLRTFAAAVYLLLLRALTIPVNLYVACGHDCAFQIGNATKLSVRSLLRLVLDLENVSHMPSTPLDPLQGMPNEMKANPVVVFGDGISEQLLSKHSIVKELARTWKIFLVCVRGSGDDALSDENQTRLESSLRDNFGERVVLLSQIADLPQCAKTLANSLFTSQALTPATTCLMAPLNSTGSSQLPEMPFDPVCYAQRRIVQSSTITSSAKVTPIPAEQLSLSYIPPFTHHSMHFFEAFSLPDAVTQLALGLSRSFFPANAFGPSLAAVGPILSPAAEGAIVSPAAYTHFLQHPASDGKVFPCVRINSRQYSCSVVLDASSLAFSYGNQHHALSTLFSLLHALASLDLPAVDVWIATTAVTRVVAGIPSRDLWKENVLSSLAAAVDSPPLVTSLERTLLYAASTCACREIPAVILVCTNGVLLEPTKKGVQAIVQTFTHQTNVQFVGIGLGLHVHGTQGVLPQFFWSADVTQLGRILCEGDEMANEINSVMEGKKKQMEAYSVYHEGCISRMKMFKSEYKECKEIMDAVCKKEKEKEKKEIEAPIQGTVEIEEVKPTLFTSEITTTEPLPAITFVKPEPVAPVPRESDRSPAHDEVSSTTDSSFAPIALIEQTPSNPPVEKKRGCCPIM